MNGVPIVTEISREAVARCQYARIASWPWWASRKGLERYVAFSVNSERRRLTSAVSHAWA
jgi:hypothetical protein